MPFVDRKPQPFCFETSAPLIFLQLGQDEYPLDAKLLRDD